MILRLRPHAFYGFVGKVLVVLGVLPGVTLLVDGADPQPQANGQPGSVVKATGLHPEQIFRNFCLACHNVDGKGGIVRTAMPDIPDFTALAWHKSKNDAELSKSILNGGKFMPPMKDKLAAEDANKMVAFIRGFKDGMVVKLDQSSSTDKPLNAAVIFRTYCMICHNEDGTGKLMRASLPALPDFTNAGFHKEHSDAQIVVSILDGKGTLMPANRGRLTETQARDLVAHVRSFGPKGSAAAPDPLQLQLEELEREMKELQNKSKELKKKS